MMYQRESFSCFTRRPAKVETRHPLGLLCLTLWRFVWEMVSGICQVVLLCAKGGLFLENQCITLITNLFRGGIFPIFHGYRGNGAARRALSAPIDPRGNASIS